MSPGKRGTSLLIDRDIQIAPVHNAPPTPQLASLHQGEELASAS